MSQNLNTWDAFYMNQVQMRQSVVGRWGVGGELHVVLGLCLMSGVCSLSVLGSCRNHCWYGIEKMTWKEKERFS